MFRKIASVALAAGLLLTAACSRGSPGLDPFVTVRSAAGRPVMSSCQRATDVVS